MKAKSSRPETPLPLTHEIYRVMKLGAFVNIDRYLWDQIKAYLEAQGATVIEDFPNCGVTRRFNVQPGPVAKRRPKRRSA